MKKNDILKAAFEEAAKTEINKLPEEEKVIRPYTDSFCEKMEELFKEDDKVTPKKKLRFGKVAVIAAVLTVLLTFTTSAMLAGDSWHKLLNFKVDPENYQNIEIEAENSYENDEVFVERVLDYTGEPIVLKYSVDTGETWNWPDRGIMIYIDGVKQTFNAKTTEGEHNNIDMLHLQNEKGTQREIEFTLQPNIGKKGDEMYLSIVCVFDPYVNYYTQCKTGRKELYPSHFDDDRDNFCDKCEIDFTDISYGDPPSLTFQSEAMFELVMKKDAPGQTEISGDYSGLVTGELDKLIYKSYDYEDGFGNECNGYDEMEGLAAEVYKDIKDAHYTEMGVSYHSLRIKTKAKEKDEFTANLHGATGKYRVGVYINGEIQQVFDGACYAEVDVVHGQQYELNFNIDTTKLPKGDNYCYVVFQKLNGEVDVFRQADRGLVYTIEVK